MTSRELIEELREEMGSDGFAAGVLSVTDWEKALATAKLRATWNAAMRDRRRALGLTQAELAQKLGVKQTTVSNWETGRAEPNPAQRLEVATALDVDANVLFEWLPVPWTDRAPTRAPMPRAVAEAALELTEWALAPVVVGDEDLADDELVAALEAAVDALPGKLGATFNALLGRMVTPVAPAAPPPKKRKAARPRPRDYQLICAVIAERGRTPEDVAEACGIRVSDLTGETTEWVDMHAVAREIGVPHPRLYDPGTGLETMRPTPRFFVWPERSHWMAEHSNVTLDTLDQTGIPRADFEAVFSGTADGTWLFANALARATGYSVTVSYGMVAPEGYNTYGPEGTLVLDRDALRKEITSPMYFLVDQAPASVAEAAPRWAHLCGMSDEKFVAMVEGRHGPTQDELRRLWRVLDQCANVDKIIYAL